VRDERVEVLGQAAGGGLVAAVLELSDQDLETELAVLDAGRVGERAPIVEADPVLLRLGQLREQVPQAVNVMWTST
jgi:hypothetical protein